MKAIPFIVPSDEMGRAEFIRGFAAQHSVHSVMCERGCISTKASGQGTGYEGNGICVGAACILFVAVSLKNFILCYANRMQ